MSNIDNPSPNFPKNILATCFEDTGRFALLNQAGTGARSFGTLGLDITTGANSGSYASVAMYAVMPSSSNNFRIDLGSPVFTATFSSNVLGNNGIFYVGAGKFGAGDGGTLRHFGFKVVTVSGTAQLYATQGDGTAETASSALVTLNSEDVVDIIVVKNGSSSIDYYYRINGGSLSSATNLTGNIPTSGGIGAGIPIYVSISNSSANTMNFSVHSASYSR